MGPEHEKGLVLESTSNPWVEDLLSLYEDMLQLSRPDICYFDLCLQNSNELRSEKYISICSTVKQL
jgi:hypothetical protein